MANVLLAVHDQKTAHVLAALLRNAGHEPVMLPDGGAALSAISTVNPDLAVVDVTGMGRPWLDAVNAVLKSEVTSPPALLVIHEAGQTSDPSLPADGPSCQRLAKPFRPPDFLGKVGKALALRSGRPAGPAQAPVGATASDRVGAVAAYSMAMRAVLRALRQLGPADVPVLIVGEPGVRKLEIAKALHELSSRASGPFVAFDCAMSDEVPILEREAFGRFARGEHDGGGGTGLSMFEKARGGSLFMGNLDILPLDLHAAVRSVLAERRLRGGPGGEEAELNFRLFASACRDVAELTMEKDAVAELLAAISPIVVRVPPLRQCREDILPLARSFMRESLGPGLDPPEFDHEVASTLQCYDWPGNTDELRAVVRYILANCTGGLIVKEHLPPELLRYALLPTIRASRA